MNEQNKIMIFSNTEFGEIRTTQDSNGEPLFCLKDVCSALLLDGKQVTRRLDDEVVSKHPITDSLGRTQMATFVNEDGLYDAILDSRKPEAQAFRKWITAEVLPQIRKTGGYIPIGNVNPNLLRPQDARTEGSNPNTPASDEEILSRALLIAQRTIELKNNLLAEQKPLVQFAEAVTSADDSILIRDLAKLITQNGVEIGQTRLFCWLRLHGYLFQRETRPIQKWVEKGIFDTDVSLIQTHRGTKEHLTTKVTGKGQRYFLDLFLRNKDKKN